MSAVSDGEALSTCSYVLRPLVKDVPLSSEEASADAWITCVELFDQNLYIGTSRGEVLHFVAIPPDTTDSNSTPQYIFATRLEPASPSNAASTTTLPGVQQILALPSVQKACVLCNGTLSFYTLPELSPAFSTTVPNCTWVGGLDLDDESASEDGVVVMICVKSKTRLVHLRDQARRLKDIEYAGCMVSVRRGFFACVADSRSYALLDVQNQQKISLFPISSLEENAATGQVEDISTTSASPLRSASGTRASQEGDRSVAGHNRSTSLGALVGGLGRRQGSPQPPAKDRGDQPTADPGLQDLASSETSHSRAESVEENSAPKSDNFSSLRPPRSSSLRPASPSIPPAPLRPHICSPSPTEFMLVTGTKSSEAGVGIFVNLDGDVVRGTIEFSRYPGAVVIDNPGLPAVGAGLAAQMDSNTAILAVVPASDAAEEGDLLEIQSLDFSNGSSKQSLRIPNSNGLRGRCSMRNVTSSGAIEFPEVGALLRNQRLHLEKNTGQPKQISDQKSKPEWETARDTEETKFVQRLGGTQSTVIVWSGSAVWWAASAPLVTKLEAALELAMSPSLPNGLLDRSSLIGVVNTIRGLEPTSDTEFLSLEYIRQKIGLLLFSDMLARLAQDHELIPTDIKNTEALLVESSLDPRVLLNMIPGLSKEVIEGPTGMWIHAGILPAIDRCSMMLSKVKGVSDDRRQLALLKKYLNSWRQRKGFGSITDEKEVFETVEAGLLQVLLQEASLLSKAGLPVDRSELYALVDSGLGCFDRAIHLLEQHHQLYVLSRLYQSKRMARKVLETWTRIIEGQKDVGGGLSDGENEVRKYLVNIKDTSLVDEYGTWLAARNPAVGVQVFTNENSRVRWEPHQVVMLLRRRAPNAVKDYLEHLVFGKKHWQYANDLISYYLDSVITALSGSDKPHSILAKSYETYRALQPPKPTYREFITANALPDAWWHDRLRLLELIGGSHGSDFSYDVGAILARIEPFENDLVPESIILDGRQGRHEQALRLLTHGLGDFHTAVNYCLLGGASIFYPSQAGSLTEAPSREDQKILFRHLLRELLLINDDNDRLERTSELLERFSNWYEVEDVLTVIPSDWSVKLILGFLTSALRNLVSERNEATVIKALSGAQNLQVAAQWVETCKEVGPTLQTEAAQEGEVQ